MANFTEDWNSSDANNDGKLNLEEFRVWMGKAKAREQAEGQYTRPDDPDRVERMYEMTNAINAAEDGAVLMDFFTLMGPWYEKYIEMNPHVMMAEELLVQIKAYAAERFNEFQTNGTAEQQAHYWEYMAKLHDPLQAEFRNGVMARVTAEWNAADADQDGLLNQDELRVWIDSTRKRHADEGFYIQPEPHYETLWSILNAVSPGADGAKLTDYFMMMTPFHAKWKELKGTN